MGRPESWKARGGRRQKGGDESERGPRARGSGGGKGGARASTPFMVRIALSARSLVDMTTKPKPLDRPCSRSITICGAAKTKVKERAGSERGRARAGSAASRAGGNARRRASKRGVAGGRRDPTLRPAGGWARAGLEGGRGEQRQPRGKVRPSGRRLRMRSGSASGTPREGESQHQESRGARPTSSSPHAARARKPTPRSKERGIELGAPSLTLVRHREGPLHARILRAPSLRNRGRGR